MICFALNNYAHFFRNVNNINFYWIYLFVILNQVRYINTGTSETISLFGNYDIQSMRSSANISLKKLKGIMKMILRKIESMKYIFPDWTIWFPSVRYSVFLSIVEKLHR